VGQGSVDLNPPGGVYTDGTTVELIANAASGWVFDHWSGALTGNTNPVQLTMDADKIVTATFTASTLPTYTLTVYTSGNGSVEKAPSQTTYISGTVVRLTAKEDPGWYFVTWRGDITIANNPLYLTMNDNKIITATFDTTPPPTHTLTVHVIGNGTVMKFPSQTTYISGTLVQLGAVPENGWDFTGWNGDLKGTQNPTSTLMNRDKAITATFTAAACENVTIVKILSNSPVEIGKPMNFAAAVTGDAPITYTWDFGGLGSGSGLDGPTPVYTYTTAGTYTVTLDVENGCPSSDTQSISVLVNPAGVCTPVSGASFNYDPKVPHTSEIITFTGQVAQGDTPITWAWAFGDGVFDSKREVTHTYTFSDTYTVVMTATNCGGTGLATATQDITILKAPSKLYLPLILRSKSGI
jgi:PKD repeat protein